MRRQALLLLAFLGVFSLTLFHNTVKPGVANATTANTISFQARLQSGTGAIVPDGTYNVEFKLYGAVSGGSPLWTEDYLNGSSQGVTVANGYLSVNLGSITAFSGINWDQKLWLTMNIGGTVGSGTFPTIGDGEMDPRLPLTAVPYAFAAGQLQTTSGSNTSKLSIQAPTGGSQTFQLQDQGGSGTFNILTAPSGSDGYVKLQGSTPGTQQTGSFNIDGTGIAGTLQATTMAATTINALTNGGNITIGNNATNLNVGTDASTSQTISIGTGATSGVNKYVHIGSTTGSSEIVLNAGSNGVSIGILGTNVATIDSGGNLTIQSLNDSNYPLSVKNSNGTSLLRTDATSGVTEVPGLRATNAFGIDIANGSLTIQGSNVALFRTPGLAGDGSNGVDLATKINIPIYDPGAFNQVIALGVSSSAASSSRVILVADARTSSHQASIALLSPDENQIFGLSWDGSSSTARLKNSANNIALEANGLSVLTAQNLSGTAVVEIGANGLNNGKIQLDNTTGTSLVLQATGVTTTYGIEFPSAKGTAGQCLAVGSVSGSTETLTHTTCGSGGGGTLQDAYDGSGTDDPQIQLSNTNGGIKIRDASSSTITNLLQIQNSNATASYFNLTASALTLGDSSTNVSLVLAGGGSTISNPQGQTGGEAFGASASVTGSRGTAVGKSATAGIDGVALGYNTSNTDNNSVAIGSGATSDFVSVAVGDGSIGGAGAVAIGSSAHATDWGGVAIGWNATVTNQQSIAIGEYATTTANNQLVIGGDDNGGTTGGNGAINDVYLGSGVTNTEPGEVTINATGGSGTNVSGGALTFAGGKSTGNVDGGNINFKISAPSGSGAALNTLSTVASISGHDGAVLFKNANNSTAGFQVQNAGGTQVFTADTVNGQVILGQGSTLAGAILFNNATNNHTVSLVSGVTSADYSIKLPTAIGVAGDCLSIASVASNVASLGYTSCVAKGSKQVTLVPEYEGAVITADGADNNGSLTSDFVSGLSSGDGYKHSYYEWTTSQATSQDYDIVINKQLPSDFNATTEFDAGSWKIWTYVDNTTDAGITMTVYDNDGTACANGVSVKSGSTGWQQITLTDFDTNSNCDFTANSVMTIRLHLSSKSPSSNKVRVGEIQYSYTQ